MPRPRRKYKKVCPECSESFHPHHRDQECCGYSCSARRSARLSEKRRTAWAKASVMTRRPKNLERLKAQLAGCKTLGDAFRLGFKKGYGQGYQARNRHEQAKQVRRQSTAPATYVRSSLAAVVAMGGSR